MNGNINIEHLFGVYQVVKNEVQTHGIPIEDLSIDGVFTFTRNYYLSVVNGTQESVIAYCGPFEVTGETIHIHVKACNYRDMENTTILRKIEKLTKDELVLSMISRDKTKTATVYWKKISGL